MPGPPGAVPGPGLAPGSAAADAAPTNPGPAAGRHGSSLRVRRPRRTPVAAALARARERHEVPLHEQPDLYQAVHAELQNALAEIDGADRDHVARRLSRLDAELVRRGLARSREHAADLIAAGPGRGARRRRHQAGDRRRRRRLGAA